MCGDRIIQNIPKSVNVILLADSSINFLIFQKKKFRGVNNFKVINN